MTSNARYHDVLTTVRHHPIISSSSMGSIVMLGHPERTRAENEGIEVWKMRSTLKCSTVVNYIIRRRSINNACQYVRGQNSNDRRKDGLTVTLSKFGLDRYRFHRR